MLKWPFRAHFFTSDIRSFSTRNKYGREPSKWLTRLWVVMALVWRLFELSVRVVFLSYMNSLFPVISVNTGTWRSLLQTLLESEVTVENKLHGGREMENARMSSDFLSMALYFLSAAVDKQCKNIAVLRACRTRTPHTAKHKQQTFTRQMTYVAHAKQWSGKQTFLFIEMAQILLSRCDTGLFTTVQGCHNESPQQAMS